MRKQFQIKFNNEVWDCIYVSTPEEVKRTLSMFDLRNEMLGLDVETYSKDHPRGGLDFITGKVRLIQIGGQTSRGKRIVIFDMMLLPEDNLIKDFLLEREFVGHNSVFDLTFLIKTFAPDKKAMPIKFHCTKILTQLYLDSVSANRSLFGGVSLKNLVEKVLKVPVNKAVQDTDWGEDLVYQQVYYAAHDVAYTLALFGIFHRAVLNNGMRKVYDLKKDVQHSVAMMTLAGLPFDCDAHNKMLDNASKEYVVQHDKIKALIGGPVTGPSIGKYLEKSLTLPVLSTWPKTEKGALKTDVNTMDEFSGLLPVEFGKSYKKYSALKKIVTTYGEAFQKAWVHPLTKRVHSQLIIDGAQTGRFSSSNPNVQNFPSSSTFRELFRVQSDNDVLVICDYSQIEVRIAAEISRDPTMLEVYERGEDIYLKTISKMTGEPYESLTKEDPRRKLGKIIVLGRLFGLGAVSGVEYARRAGVIITLEESRKHTEDFKTKIFPRYAQWQDEVSKRAEHTLSSKTIMGKVRKLDPSKTHGASMNTPIQGSAAELISLALINTHSDIVKRSLPVVQVGCVHDEILFQCRADDAERVKKWAEAWMTKSFKDLFKSNLTKGLVNTFIGKSWAEKH